LQAALRAEPEALPSAFADFDEKIWSILDRASVDPHAQLVREGFHLVSCVTALCGVMGERPVVAELGSTFCAARVKFEIIDAIARQKVPSWQSPDPRWVGLDNSTFMRDVSLTLHHDSPPTILDDYAKFQGDDRSIFVARFVASYAFSKTEAFAEFIAANFGAMVLEDAFSTTDGEVRTENHGQPEIFFNLPRLQQMLAKEGFTFYLLSSYPDYPAETAPCHVIKLLALRREVPVAPVAATLDAMGFAFDPERQRVDATLLEKLNAAVSPERWQQVQSAKARSPVWGPSPEASPTSSMVSRVRDWLRERFGADPWGHYRLSGEMAREQIRRAVSSSDRMP